MAAPPVLYVRAPCALTGGARVYILKAERGGLADGKGRTV